MLRGASIYLSSLVPFGGLANRVQQHVIAPFYHTVASDTPPHIKYLYPIVTPELFRKDLEFMLRFFSPVDASEIVRNPAKSRSGSKPRLLLSFDDGFSEISNVVAPILLEKGVPATFFVNSGFIDNQGMLYRCKISLILSAIDGDKSFTPSKFLVDTWGERTGSRQFLLRKLLSLGYNDSFLVDSIAQSMGVDWRGYLSDAKPYLSLAELRALAKQGFAIGAHSVTHPSLAHLPFERAVGEVVDSIQWVQEHVPDQPRLFSFPFTDHGLPKEFYRYFFEQHPHLTDIMFGTAGLKPTPTGRLIHRIPMELKGKNARSVLGGEMLYYLAKRLIGRGRINVG